MVSIGRPCCQSELGYYGDFINDLDCFNDYDDLTDDLDDLSDDFGDFTDDLDGLASIVETFIDVLYSCLPEP